MPKGYTACKQCGKPAPSRTATCSACQGVVGDPVVQLKNLLIQNLTSEGFFETLNILRQCCEEKAKKHYELYETPEDLNPWIRAVKVINQIKSDIRREL